MADVVLEDTVLKVSFIQAEACFKLETREIETSNVHCTAYISATAN